MADSFIPANDREAFQRLIECWHADRRPPTHVLTPSGEDVPLADFLEGWMDDDRLLPQAYADLLPGIVEDDERQLHSYRWAAVALAVVAGVAPPPTTVRLKWRPGMTEIDALWEFVAAFDAMGLQLDDDFEVTHPNGVPDEIEIAIPSGLPEDTERCRRKRGALREQRTRMLDPNGEIAAHQDDPFLPVAPAGHRAGRELGQWFRQLEARYPEEGSCALSDADVEALAADPEACERLFSDEHDAFTAGLDRGRRAAHNADEANGIPDAANDEDEA